MIPANRLRRIARNNRIISAFPAWTAFRDRRQLAKYVRNLQRGGPEFPFPDIMKRAIIAREARSFGAEALIETGTYLGETIWFFRNTFKKIISIEVQPELAELARKRFANYPHITILTGDSADEIGKIASSIDSRCIFWLDGHYSAGITGRGKNDCPIWAELEAICSWVKHPFLILIDDARCFGADPAYPSQEEIFEYIRKQFPQASVSIESDIMRIRI